MRTHPEVKHKRKKNYRKRIEKIEVSKEIVKGNFSGLKRTLILKGSEYPAK